MENLIAIVNVADGTFIQREMNEDELAQDLHNRKKNKDTTDAIKVQKAEFQAQRQIVLERLGINDEEAKLLLG